MHRECSSLVLRTRRARHGFVYTDTGDRTFIMFPTSGATRASTKRQSMIRRDRREHDGVESSLLVRINHGDFPSPTEAPTLSPKLDCPMQRASTRLHRHEVIPFIHTNCRRTSP